MEYTKTKKLVKRAGFKILQKKQTHCLAYVCIFQPKLISDFKWNTGKKNAGLTLMSNWQSIKLYHNW